ncbi:hypothetical protein K0M31_005435 [Melipona bicolor]|uniref:Uncharacterized protein n=1 Tax=Melipona bicolor TaxID=60889 RepID=A0AA40KMU2_9HYME|nr:hypothetical protein K0M31_005435 [Melipona bicolor]
MLPELEIGGVGENLEAGRSFIREQLTSSTLHFISFIPDACVLLIRISSSSIDGDTSSRYLWIPDEPVTHPVDIQLDNQSLQGRND